MQMASDDCVKEVEIHWELSLSLSMYCQACLLLFN
jgi:hypothetical protein